MLLYFQLKLVGGFIPFLHDSVRVMNILVNRLFNKELVVFFSFWFHKSSVADYNEFNLCAHICIDIFNIFNSADVGRWMEI